AGRAPRRKFGQRQPGAALRFLQAPSWARRKNRLSARGQSRRGAACGRNSRGGSGCAVEALPAAETAETEQGPPSKFASGPRPAPEIWATATRSRAPVFASALLGAPEKPAKRKRASRRPRDPFPAGRRPAAAYRPGRTDGNVCRAPQLSGAVFVSGPIGEAARL